MRKSLNSLIVSTALTCSSLAYAAGPLVLSGPSGNTPVTYENPMITLHVESGTLGAKTNAQADALFQEAISLWNNVSTSTIDLVFDDTVIPEDIDGTNFEDYLPKLDGSEFYADDEKNPIVYDDDGAIIDAYFGVGQSDTTIGFAASIFTIAGNYFLEGYAVINGKNLIPDDTLKLLVAHEIGHFFGLDHSQGDQPSFCVGDRDNYPAMYPFACRDSFNLHPDDTSSVSALYPNASTDSSYGTLNGRLLDQSGRAILGANIWAKNTITDEVYSVVSDYLKQGNGFYQLRLPAGNYELRVGSINTAFWGGSSVGPYALTRDSASFDCPHPITETVYEGATPGTSEIITISNGAPATTINFSLADVDVDACPKDPVLLNNGGSKGQLSLLGLISLSVLLAWVRIARVTTRCEE